MELNERRPWAEDPDLGILNVDPDEALPSMPLKKVPVGDIYEAARAGDVDRLSYLIESGVNVNARDRWDSVALYYACLAGHAEAARMLLLAGAICSERTFDGDRCHYAALNLRIRRLLKAFETRPPPMGPLQAALRDSFLGCEANRAYLNLCDKAGIGMAGLAAQSSDVKILFLLFQNISELTIVFTSIVLSQLPLAFVTGGGDRQIHLLIRVSL